MPCASIQSQVARPLRPGVLGVMGVPNLTLANGSSVCRCLLANEGGVPLPARLDAPLQRSRIDGDEAKTKPVAARPLEVIEQGPGEVAPHGDPTLARPRDSLNMIAQVGDPLLVMNIAGWCIRLVKGRAVLGYQ